MVIEKLGRYEIVSVIGKGAMGLVYRAVDPLIDRIVAVKTINLDLSKDELAQFEKRFQREVKSAGRLNHPNIVTVFDVGKSDGIAYMAMEFLEGQELRDMLDSGTVLPNDKIARIIAEVAEGLAYAHDHGVVHRDIKPSNIMILRNGLVKIMDFGVAHMPTGSRTMAGMVLGSPKYMSPEQVVGQTVDGRSDIFSLGVVLYETLTGHPPFAGDNISNIMYRILNENPSPPNFLNIGLPERFNDIVAKALAKRPEDRYQTAREMSKDLRALEKQILTASRSRRALDQQHKLEAAAGSIMPDVTVSMPEEDPASVMPRRKHALAATRWWHSRSFTYGLISATALTVAGLLVVGTMFDHNRQSEPLIVTHEAPKIAAGGHSAAVTAVAKTAQANPPASVASAPAPAVERMPIPAEEPAVPAPASIPLPQFTPLPDARQTPATAGLAFTPSGDSLESKLGERNRAKAKAERKKQLAQSSAAEDEVATAPNATVTFAITPWGEIFVDGRKEGVSPPLTEIRLKPGRHRIEIKNSTFPTYSNVVHLQSSGKLKIKHKFD